MVWVTEQVMKLMLSTTLSGIAWVLLVASMGLEIPFWVIWIICTFGVFGIVYLLENDGDWDFF